MVHITLHLLVPGIIAFFFYQPQAWKAWLMMMATMIVDADHLLANPIYDPERCSIGFHPLHSYPAIVIYVLSLFWPRTRIVGIGLVSHMALDYADCLF